MHIIYCCTVDDVLLLLHIFTSVLVFVRVDINDLRISVGRHGSYARAILDLWIIYVTI